MIQKIYLYIAIYHLIYIIRVNVNAPKMKSCLYKLYLKPLSDSSNYANCRLLGWGELNECQGRALITK